MISMEKNNISPDSLKTEYVSPETCIFALNENGFLSLLLNEVRYPRVILTRSLPVTRPDEYVCISDTEKKELGIIRQISDFSPEQRKLINDELSQRYFCPCITTIDTIKEKMGHFYFDVHIGEYKKSFTVKDISKNIRMHAGNVDLTDIDGNRYRITEFEKIPAKSRKKLEPYIY